MRNFIIGLVLLLALSGCRESDTSSVNREVNNLIAFAKVYGHVKYFHPSDESRQINWDKFAIAGVNKITAAKNSDDLKKTLDELFLPIAPTIRITEMQPDSGSFIEQYLNEIPKDSADLFPVFWQHLGVNLEQKNSVYSSNRRYRIEKPVDRNFFLFQNFSNQELNGNMLRFSASIKAEIDGEGNRGGLYLRVDDSEGYPLYIKKANDILNSTEWKKLEHVAALADGANQVTAGIKINGDGKLWVDDVHLEVKNVKGEWESASILNPGFEDQTNGRPHGWRATVTGNYDFNVVSELSLKGENSFFMSNRDVNPPVRLFKKKPEIGETAIQKISEGLWSEVPLALYGDLESTYPKSSDSELQRLKSNLDTIDLEYATAEDKNVRLANIIIAWTELQHFYPYFDVVDVDWEEELRTALSESLTDQTPDEFFKTLSKMLASTNDGHISPSHSLQNSEAGLPFLVDWIDGQVVVTNSVHPDIKPGDIILSLDGKPSEEIINNHKKFIPGSPQLSLFRAMNQFGTGETNSEVNLKVKKESGIETYSIKRQDRSSFNFFENDHLPEVGEIHDGIFYVNLDKASMDQIRNKIEAIATSKGVIFDLRGYPNRNHEVISHLLIEPDTSGRWMQVPQIIYPDRKNITGYQEHGWFMKPAEPHIRGKVVFITDGRAISYAESIMSFVEHYDLGEIVGQPTAGTNGNINFTSLPGGYQYAWTGMKVVKHDGSQHHQIGIQPTVPVEKTIQGVRNGRDEFLDKAIDILDPNIISKKEAVID